MTPLEQAVLGEMVRLNAPMRPEDPPYPICLLPMVRATIEAVRKHDGEQAAA